MNSNDKKFVPIELVKDIPLIYKGLWFLNFEHMMDCLEYAHHWKMSAITEADKRFFVSNFVRCLKQPKCMHMHPSSSVNQIEHSALWLLFKPRVQLMVFKYLWDCNKEALDLVKQTQMNDWHLELNMLWYYVQEESTDVTREDIEKNFGTLCQMRDFAVTHKLLP